MYRWLTRRATAWGPPRRLIEVLDDGTVRPLPLYIGNDLTDEDGFRAIRDDGIPIVVRDAPRPTFARYALDGPSDVGRFLRAVCGRRGSPSGPNNHEASTTNRP